jgi:hypothetical protein
VQFQQAQQLLQWNTGYLCQPSILAQSNITGTRTGS